RPSRSLESRRLPAADLLDWKPRWHHLGLLGEQPGEQLVRQPPTRRQSWPRLPLLCPRFRAHLFQRERGPDRALHVRKRKQFLLLESLLPPPGSARKCRIPDAVGGPDSKAHVPKWSARS